MRLAGGGRNEAVQEFRPKHALHFQAGERARQRAFSCHPLPAVHRRLHRTPAVVLCPLLPGGTTDQVNCSACGARTGPKGWEGLGTRTWECPCGAAHDRDVNAAKNIAAWGLLGVEARVSAVRLERDAKQAKALERKTKLAVNKTAKAVCRLVVAAGHGRPVEGIPVLSRVSGQPLG